MSRRGQTVLTGHALPDEGRAFDEHGYRRQAGPAHCECGWTSPQIAVSDNERRRLHAEHKLEQAAKVLAEHMVSNPNAWPAAERVARRHPRKALNLAVERLAHSGKDPRLVVRLAQAARVLEAGQ